MENIDNKGEIVFFRTLLRRLGKRCEEGDLDEREVVTLFAEQGFFSSLGYDSIGEDLRLEQHVRGGRVDVVMRGVTGRPICVVEFKRPNTDLAAHQAQLEEYVRELLPEYAALTDGVQFRLFRRYDATLREMKRISLKEPNQKATEILYQVLHKRVVDWQRLSSVREALKECSEEPIKITAPEKEGGRVFLNQFALIPQVAFGQLTKTLFEVLPICVKQSDFARGAYNFWEKIYARRLGEREVTKLVKSWKGLVGQAARRVEIYHFMFALETSYAILSRLMLAKAMQDAGFPDLNAMKAFERELEVRNRHGILKLSVYVAAVQAVFSESKRQGFKSLFDNDIFDWWLDLPELNEAATEAFEALAKAALAVLQFDFTGLSGDLLGNLYQSYFNPETRKALGEFYTPPEVVEFILDHVGYRGTEITMKRLLDPACGSGTFLVHALQRYLRASKSHDPRDTLNSLIDGLRIVGFDINPFAVLMTQVNYALHLLPLYAEALQQDPEFEIPLLPIFRTDSLRQEKREGEKEKVKWDGMLGFTFEAKGDVGKIKTELPVEIKAGEFLKLEIPVPRYDRAHDYGYVDNAEEYFRAQHAMFEAIRQASEHGTIAPNAMELEEIFAGLGLVHAAELARYVQPSAEKIIEEIEQLRTEYEDGRFLRTLEDLALAMTLKHELRYDFVVGNPPYIRIQNIPEVLRSYWQGIYEWAEGNFDIYVPFIERAMKYWLGEDGRFGFIVSNRFTLANYAKQLRKHLPEIAELEFLVDLKDTRVFKDALNYPAILIAKRTNSPSAKEFLAARVFGDPAAEDEEGEKSNLARVLLQEICTLLDRAKVTKKHELGHYTDAFIEKTGTLLPQGWYLMPKDERRVFKKLETAGTCRLEDLTTTQSGGFQGYATSADKIMVLKFVEERGDVLLLRPKGSDAYDEPVEFEKKLVRPWLFGRDVERWHIAWDGWYVLFPYVKVNGSYKLIPSKEYLDKEHFDYLDRCSLVMDRDFPKAWEYLKQHEQALRSREGGRYKRGNSEEHLWYGAARPQNLELYEQAKTLFQVSSTSSDVALDQDGHFVFTAGGTSGVYGAAFRSDLNTWLLLSLLNSSSLDFYLKHVSTIYTGHAYSYGDQFIKLLPIRLPTNSDAKAIAKSLIKLAQDLTKTKEDLREKERERAQFPNPQLTRRPGQLELYPLSRLVKGAPRSAQIRVADIALQQQLDGSWAFSFGRSTLIFSSEVQAQLVKRWLQLQGRGQVLSDDLMRLRLPQSEEVCQKLLDTLTDTENQIEELRRQIEEKETEVNELVTDLYGLDRQDRRIINAFLARF